MTSEQIAAIERLRELEKHVLPLNWQVDETNEENIVDSNGLFVAETCSDDDAALIVALRNDGMPLIEALQQSLSEAQADARVFSNSYNALAEDFGRLKEENERLRVGIGRALEKAKGAESISLFSRPDLIDAIKELEALHDA